MDHAWLDSLSEDWVSQPRSSGSPVPSLSSFSNSATSESSNLRTSISRIPKFDPKKQEWTAAHEPGNSPLSERNLSEINIPISQRASRVPSKLRDEMPNSMRGRPSRRASISTVASSPYNTIQHKSVSLSPEKRPHETPEWKRRLIHGEVAYGEQRDLFAPAGLENIFRPPSPQNALAKTFTSQNFEDRSAMPSSPPVYHNLQETRMGSDPHPKKKPGGIEYKLVDEDSDDFSANDLSYSSNFRPVLIRSQQENSKDGKSHTQLQPSTTYQKLGMESTLRMVSGQSDKRNEELSPIYLSQNNTTRGKINYAAMDVSSGELQERLDNLQEESQQEFTVDYSVENDTSQALPANITVETEDYAHNGHFVNLRRGGHSEEGSFQKRMLSSTSLPAIDESDMLPEESMQASTPKQLSNLPKTRASAELLEIGGVHTPPPVPQTPHPSPSKSGNGEQKTSSGSPLKLFGTYDTFTNQTLLRRLSQFEEHFDGDGIQGSTVDGQESASRELSGGLGGATSQEKPQKFPKTIAMSRRVSSFGVGDLDNFPFSEEVPYDSSKADSQDEDKENLHLPILNPKTQTSFKFQLEDSPSIEEAVSTKRQMKITSTRSTTTKRIVSIGRTRSRTPESDSRFDSHSSIGSPSPSKIDITTPRKSNGDSEWKRLAKSPLKQSTSKRRRTLHGTETGQYSAIKDEIEAHPAQQTHYQMQSVLSKKRKDARYDDDQQAANPKVLAMRQILRPRTPTPSQRSSIQRERAPLQELNISPHEQARLLQEQKIAMVQAELDSNEPPKNPMMALGVSQNMFDESRKGSITTQDFLDEAKMIMAGIRGKTRPNSGLSSLEESEMENERNTSIGNGGPQSDDYDDSYQESTKEPFSRPPSREGAPIAPRQVKQQDPALLDHLRKYAELSDMDDIVASSIRSIAMAKNAAQDAKEIDRVTEETISRAASARLIESDPPNIRITESTEIKRKRKHSASTVEKNSDDNQEFPSQSSTTSTQSTQSIPTGSSRGSDSRRVIAPHTVSHLIPEELAGMLFDRDRNIWIKNKTVSGEGGLKNLTPSDDDDPFGDIPDLSVDETQEMQRTKAVAAKRKEEERIAQDHFKKNDETDQRPKSEIPHSFIPERPREAFASASVKPSQNNGSDHSDVLVQDDSPKPHAKDGSRMTETKKSVHQTSKMTRSEARGGVVEEVEKEISIHEDRVTSATSKRRRNVTITFSSPIASIRQMSPPMSPYRNEGDSGGNTDEISHCDYESDECSGDDSVVIAKARSSHNSTPSKPPASFRATSRRLSLGGHKFSARPVSRIDEHDEDLDIAEQRTISVVVGTNGKTRKSSVMVVTTPRQAREIGTLELTPMSDFTMNQRDSSFGLDVSYVEGGQRYALGRDSSQTLSLSIKNLVEKLTEVEPYEPFWESMKEVNLNDKRLSNLHKLDEFCPQLEDLDVSGNQISQLNGVPITLRHLSIGRNYLSDLTAWSHLSNLQYVDVSNNELESLSAFSSLVHLRGLRADNNKIKSLDGIGNLDGLLSLRLRGNMLQAIDFRGTKLQRLSDMDLNGNQISSLQNIHELRHLTTLSLDNNNLTTFNIEVSEKHETLKHLRLNGNLLESIDVSQMPNLRLLYLDQNRLGTITGLLKTKYLDSLSMREQRDGCRLNTAFLSEAFEIRKLFISANLLEPFAPRANFLNLQYLEIANCGLEHLPAEFGEMFPNVRVLNLSMNALRNIDALVGIVRLKTLHLAGNRLSMVRKTMEILKGFPTLTTVDLRNNAFNVGFYSPALERQVAELDNVDSGKQPCRREPFTLAKCNKDWDNKYLSRLDMTTKKSRRIYEMMLLGGSKRLRNLDGLQVDRAVLKAQDDVWEALVKTGVLKGKLPTSPPVAKDCPVQVKVVPPTPVCTPVGTPKKAPEPRGPMRTLEVPPTRPWRTTGL